eukprot:TRINITY_DN650_c0_g1_i1.p1 TRINITY_DN650_c0_g1~~TRINITY_DN650_c0_g1_i1.p1  ORF type:complete len:161 (-),score=47.75 TRINITY_DN650_c0_g1_i1:101-538(-)
MADDEDQGGEVEDAVSSGVNHADNLSKREANVNKLLSTSKTLDALKATLENPPIGTKDQNIIDKSTAVTVAVLTAVKETDIQKHVDSLSDDEQNILMKYVYKGMENGENSTSLLKWHSTLVEKSGLGLIIRALSDRNAILTIPAE